jgi:putative methionine-R-sulfoxide reductase with GAF domain
LTWLGGIILDKIIKATLDNLPSWFFQLTGVVLLIAICIFLWLVLFGTSKLSKIFQSILKRDDRIEDLHNKLAQEKERSSKFEGISLQLTTACHNIRTIIEALNNIRAEEDVSIRVQEIVQLIQKWLDTLASDIKTKAGGSHRCGLWIQEQDNLRLAFTSSGFPKNYANSRILNINRSVAGRCIRRMQVVNSDDVRSDSDWETNPESKSQYTSLICVPISDWIVLSVDGSQPMGEHIQLLSELYATALEGIIREHIMAISALTEINTVQEVGASSEDET